MEVTCGDLTEQVRSLHTIQHSNYQPLKGCVARVKHEPLHPLNDQVRIRAENLLALDERNSGAGRYVEEYVWVQLQEQDINHVA